MAAPPPQCRSSAVDQVARSPHSNAEGPVMGGRCGGERLLGTVRKRHVPDGGPEESCERQPCLGPASFIRTRRCQVSSPGTRQAGAACGRKCHRCTAIEASARQGHCTSVEFRQRQGDTTRRRGIAGSLAAFRRSLGPIYELRRPVLHLPSGYSEVTTREPLLRPCVQLKQSERSQGQRDATPAPHHRHRHLLGGFRRATTPALLCIERCLPEPAVEIRDWQHPRTE